MTAILLTPQSCIPASYCYNGLLYELLYYLVLCCVPLVTISWLKQMWSCKSEDGELAESAAIKLARQLNPFIRKHYAKRIVAVISHEANLNLIQVSLHFD